jgi:hypothetical protein
MMEKEEHDPGEIGSSILGGVGPSNLGGARLSNIGGVEPTRKHKKRSMS